MARVEQAFRESIIHVVSDFNNDLSPTECVQSIHKVFRKHEIPFSERNPIAPPVADVRPFNITDGAFQIAQLADNMRDEPAIFVGVVDPGVGSERKGIVVTTDEPHVFIGPDNGLFWPALSEQTITGAYKITEGKFAESAPTFHGRDQFAPLAGEIASGVRPEDIGHLEQISVDELVKKEFSDGEVVHLDGYMNVKLGEKGIPLDERGRRAEAAILWTPQAHLFAPVVDKFEDVAVGEWLVYEGSSGRGRKGAGHVEVAIRDRAKEQGAGAELGVDVGDVVQIQWQFASKKGGN